jgi:Fe-S cluster assembly ATP-binding protein
MQYPTEVPGVAVVDVLEAAYAGLGRDPSGVADRIRTEAGRIGFDDKILHRAMNVDLSGGEKKRNETLQLGVLEPKIAILDEIDSGLDVDALRACARRIEAATEETGLGVLAITHYNRLLHELRADHVHVLSKGTIQRSGGPELALELERIGYAGEEEETP